MPNRILRDGILSSEGVNALSWAEEVFYRRLMSVVDDFGRYYASPKLLRAACYPLHIDKVSDADIGKWLTACVSAGLVRVYTGPDGKSYLELLNFRQQVRAKESKFPQPSSACVADAKQVQANAHLDEDEDGDEKDPPKPPKGVSSAVSFKTWAQAIRASGEKLIPENDAVFDYAEAAGIPHDFIHLAWTEFTARHSAEGAKKYKDFRRAFRNCVRANWYRLWVCDSNGYRLSTNGEQAQRAREGVAA